MKIGVIGYKGRLGSQLIYYGCEPIDYDITSQKKLDGVWDVVINCAAYSDVDGVQKSGKNYWEAIDINGRGVDYLAHAYEGEIIHMSTDYVFGGKRGPYSEDYRAEDDLPPIKNTGYSVSKFLGEMYATLHDHVYIVRTTGLYGGVSGKHDFVKMILNAYAENLLEIKVTGNLFGNQTYIPHLASGLLKYARIINKPKILHIASKEVVSRYEFALMIAHYFGLDRERIFPIKSSEISGWIAERPEKAGLKVDLAQELEIPIYTIAEGLEAYKGE